MKNQNNLNLKGRTQDKYIGCMLGGAIGDALGAPIEFMSISEIRSKFGIDGVTDYVEFADGRGEFTDDTQMTLFTAEALLKAEYISIIKGITGTLPIVAHHSYLRWLRTQNIPVCIENIKDGVYNIKSGWLIKQKLLYKRKAPGNTCISALSSGLAGTINNPINESKGCGTIMRITPVGLLSAGFLASVISDLAIGIDLEESIYNASSLLRKWDNHTETLHAVNSAIELYQRIKSSGNNPIAEDLEKLGQGWVAEEALSISIFSSLLYQNNFEKGVLYSVNHSGDSDSTGSITGNILGLINGKDSIPSVWIEKLEANEIVSQIGKDLFIGVKDNSFNKDKEWLEKYAG